jgi:hypothetical protein
MWQAIDGFLTTTEGSPRPVEDLYEVLKAPPFGIKDGLLPIYLIAAMLHWESEIALYEKGSFIPEVGSAECERLMKLPETFSVQRYRLDEARQHMLYEYSMLFDDELDPGHVSQLTAVRPIIAFAKQLPRYTQITQSLSEEAIAVREALLSAQEPQPLLLEELPTALSFDVSESVDEAIEEYFSQLKRTLVELQTAYERLLLTIQDQLLDALLLPSDLEAARQEITLRSQLLQNWVAELELKAFISRLGDQELTQREWLESVSSCLVHKPPSKWNDEDVIAYRIALADMAQRFRRTEDVALAQDGLETEAIANRAFRLSVIDGTGHEKREIVHLPSGRDERLEESFDALREALNRVQADRRTSVMALAELARDLLSVKRQSSNRDIDQL